MFRGADSFEEPLRVIFTSELILDGQARPARVGVQIINKRDGLI